MEIEKLIAILETDITLWQTEVNNKQNLCQVITKLLPKLSHNQIFNREKEMLSNYFGIDARNVNLNQLVPSLKTAQIEYQIKIEELVFRLSNARRIVNLYKYNQIISPNFVHFIKNYLTEKGFNDIAVIKTCELIRIYNKHLDETKSEKMSNQDLYLILNILMQGFEQIPLEENENHEKLYKAALKAINLIDNNNFSLVEEALNFENIYSYDDLVHLYGLILKHYQDEIFDLVEMLKIKDFYFDKQTLGQIVKNYKNYIARYNFIREKMDSLEPPVKEEEQVEEEENIEALENANNLYYSSNSDEPSRCYFMRDLEAIRAESYGKIWEMLNDFKNGQLKNFKILTSPLEGAELKYDQIRIILKQMGANNYSVQGVFIKKTDVDRPTYAAMFSRPIANKNQNVEEIEQVIENFILENKRTGSRQ